MRKLTEYFVVLAAACACLASWGCASRQPLPPQTVDQWMDLEPVTP